MTPEEQELNAYLAAMGESSAWREPPIRFVREYTYPVVGLPEPSLAEAAMWDGIFESMRPPPGEPD